MEKDKQMNCMKVLLIGMCTLLTFGCETTYAVRPMGEQPVRLQAKDWEGLRVGGEAVSIRLVDDRSRSVGDRLGRGGRYRFQARVVSGTPYEMR